MSEYIAESFAWTTARDGIDVPPATLAFLSSLERTPRWRRPP